MDQANKWGCNRLNPGKLTQIFFPEILAFTTSGSAEKKWYFFELVNSVHKFFRRKQEHVVTPCSEHVLELSFQRPDSWTSDCS